MLYLMLMAISREARRVGRAMVLQAGRSVHGACGVQVQAGGLQGRAAALGLWEALVVSVQTQVLYRHQLTCQTESRTPSLTTHYSALQWVLGANCGLGSSYGRFNSRTILPHTGAVICSDDRRLLTGCILDFVLPSN